MPKSKNQSTTNEDEMRISMYVLEFVKMYNHKANFNFGHEGAYRLTELDSKGKELRVYVDSFDVCFMVFNSTNTDRQPASLNQLTITDEALAENAKARQKGFQDTQEHIRTAMGQGIDTNTIRRMDELFGFNRKFPGKVDSRSETVYNSFNTSPGFRQFTPPKPLEGYNPVREGNNQLRWSDPSIPPTNTPFVTQGNLRTGSPLYPRDYMTDRFTHHQQLSVGYDNSKVWIKTEFGKINMQLMRQRIDSVLVLHGIISKQLPVSVKDKIEDSRFLVLECLFESFFEILSVAKEFYKIENHEIFITAAHKFVSNMAAFCQALNSGHIQILEESISHDPSGNVTKIVITDYKVRAK